MRCESCEGHNVQTFYEPRFYGYGKSQYRSFVRVKRCSVCDQKEAFHIEIRFGVLIMLHYALKTEPTPLLINNALFYMQMGEARLARSAKCTKAELHRVMRGISRPIPQALIDALMRAVIREIKLAVNGPKPKAPAV